MRTNTLVEEHRGQVTMLAPERRHGSLGFIPKLNCSVCPLDILCGVKRRGTQDIWNYVLRWCQRKSEANWEIYQGTCCGNIDNKHACANAMHKYFPHCGCLIWPPPQQKQLPRLCKCHTSANVLNNPRGCHFLNWYAIVNPDIVHAETWATVREVPCHCQCEIQSRNWQTDCFALITKLTPRLLNAQHVWQKLSHTLLGLYIDMLTVDYSGCAWTQLSRIGNG